MAVTVNLDTTEDLGVVDLAQLEALAGFVLQEMFVHAESDGAISFVSAAEMEKLHLEWMNLPGATDVMSFPMDELTPGDATELSGPGTLGDIVICLEVAAEQAAAAEHSLQAEINLLATHSLLHLLGYDHDTPVKKAEMFGLQQRLLTDFAAAFGREKNIDRTNAEFGGGSQ